MPKVYNKRTGFPENAVLVDRTTIFGNPFVIGKDGTRKQVIQKYKHKLDNDPQLRQKVRDLLEGKDLVCWCSPLECHADILLIYANESLF